MQQTTFLTIKSAELPSKVSALCIGLMKISASYSTFHLNSIFDELESQLSKNSDHFDNSEAHSEQKSLLRDIKRERERVLTSFLQALESKLAAIRKVHIGIQSIMANSTNLSLDGLSLVEHGYFEQKQLLISIAARCESQNNQELHALRQRLAVLAGEAPFLNDELPLSPSALCDCLQTSLKSLDLTTTHAELLFKLVDKRLLGSYGKLLEQCNNYLAEHKVLSNLSFITFRNPELRFKKSAIAIKGGQSSGQKDATTSTKIPKGPLETDIHPSMQQAAIEKAVAAAKPVHSFQNFRELLALKKQQMSEFGTGTDSALIKSPSNVIPASRDLLNSILSNLQLNPVATSSSASSVHAIKQQIQAQLFNQSSSGKGMSLAPEDSDAIDMFAMLMDSASQSFKPDSATSQLMSMLQAPLIRLVLQDKSFFENHVHPARKMLDTLAETGINWLDIEDRDERLYANIVDIVSDMSKNYNGDNQSLQKGYDETQRLLQTLIKKAESIERRQIEIAKGKERLGIARSRAEDTIETLIAGRALTEFTKSMLVNAWTDVLVLTELRHGNDSPNWHAIRDTAESIITAGELKSAGQQIPHDDDLLLRIQESLQLVGYHAEEAISVSERLLQVHENEIPTFQPLLPDKSDEIQGLKHGKPVFNLNEQQHAYLNQIKTLPFGTWFEFKAADNVNAERRKMAWASHTTHHMLFVNARGQKVSEMLIEELAIEMSSGLVSLIAEDRRGFIERALDSAFNSLKDLLPGKPGAAE